MPNVEALSVCLRRRIFTFSVLDFSKISSPFNPSWFKMEIRTWGSEMSESFAKFSRKVYRMKEGIQVSCSLVIAILDANKPFLGN